MLPEQLGTVSTGLGGQRFLNHKTKGFQSELRNRRQKRVFGCRKRTPAFAVSAPNHAAGATLGARDSLLSRVTSRGRALCLVAVTVSHEAGAARSREPDGTGGCTGSARFPQAPLCIPPGGDPSRVPFPLEGHVQSQTRSGSGGRMLCPSCSCLSWAVRPDGGSLPPVSSLQGTCKAWGQQSLPHPCLTETPLNTVRDPSSAA